MIKLKKNDVSEIIKETPDQLNGLKLQDLQRYQEGVGYYTDINGNTYMLNLAIFGYNPILVVSIDGIIKAEGSPYRETIEVSSQLKYVSSVGTGYTIALLRYKGITYYTEIEVNNNYRLVGYKDYNNFRSEIIKEYPRFSSDLLKDPMSTSYISI